MSRCFVSMIVSYFSNVQISMQDWKACAFSRPYMKPRPCEFGQSYNSSWRFEFLIILSDSIVVPFRFRSVSSDSK